MMLKIVESYSSYLEIADRYNRRGCTTNDYIQRGAESLIMQRRLFALCGDNNAFLFVQKDTCLRLYYYINDFNELVSFDENNCYVVEILFRGVEFFPDEVVNYLEKTGFKSNVTRDQYSGTFKVFLQEPFSSDVRIAPAQSIDEVVKACELFNRSFDHFSGDYVPASDFEMLFDEKSILIAKDSTETMLGALHQTIESRVAWISHIAVLPEARGKHIGSDLVKTFIRNNQDIGIYRFMLWVQSHNATAVRMYEKLGFKNLGKSTLSMIKDKIQ